MTAQIPKEKVGECKVLGRYPNLFSTPVFFFDHKNGKMNSGTLTLLDAGHGLIGITCWHVIQSYLKQLAAGAKLSFQIGSIIVEPEPILIAYDEELDLATLKLNHDMLPAFKGKSFPDAGQTISKIYQEEVKKGDIIILGGYPGKWVEYSNGGYPIFETFSIGRCPVYSAGAIQYCCHLENPNSWPVQKEIYPTRSPKDLLDPGGLSGCAVFVEVTSESNLVSYEFAGVVYEGRYPFGGTTLLLEIRPAKLIQPNGKIQRDFAAQCNLTHVDGAYAIEGELEDE
jgi:hypothetical protein